MKNEALPERPTDPRDDPRLTAFVLDELPAAERARLERDIENDPALAEELRAISAVSAGLRAALKTRAARVSTVHDGQRS